MDDRTLNLFLNLLVAFSQPIAWAAYRKPPLGTYSYILYEYALLT